MIYRVRLEYVRSGVRSKWSTIEAYFPSQAARLFLEKLGRTGDEIVIVEDMGEETAWIVSRREIYFEDMGEETAWIVSRREIYYVRPA